MHQLSQHQTFKKIKCKHFQEANSFLYSTSSFNVQVYFFHLNILNICFLNLGYMSAKIIRHYVTFNTKNIQQFTNVTHPCFNNTVYVSYCTRGKKILIDLFKHFTNRWEQVMGMYIVRTVYNTLYTVQCSIVCLYNNTSHSKKGFCKLMGIHKDICNRDDSPLHSTTSVASS